MPNCNDSTRQFVRSEQRLVSEGYYGRCGNWIPAKYKTVKIYRRVKPKSISQLRPGDRHPTTGIRIPNPNDKYAQYPGKGFCRTVVTTRVKKYKTDRYGNRKLVKQYVKDRQVKTGWHPCPKKSGC